MSLIFLRVQPIAAAPAGEATLTAGEQQPFIRLFKPNNENNLQQALQIKEQKAIFRSNLFLFLKFFRP